MNFGKQARSPVIFADSEALEKEYNQGSYDQVVNGSGPASPFLLAHTFGFCFIYILSTGKGHTIVQEEYIDTPVYKIGPKFLGGFYSSLSDCDRASTHNFWSTRRLGEVSRQVEFPNICT